MRQQKKRLLQIPRHSKKQRPRWNKRPAGINPRMEKGGERVAELVGDSADACELVEEGDGGG